MVKKMKMSIDSLKEVSAVLRQARKQINCNEKT